MQTSAFRSIEAPPLAAIQQTELWQRLYGRYTDFCTQIDIAEQFCAWARNRADGEQLLLQAKADSTYVFIGDTHGEFDTLLAIICHVCSTANNKRPHFVLLGDCIDRGRKDLAILALVEEALMQQTPAEFDLSYLCGNHDLALDVLPGGFFYSAVTPADTANKLNCLSKQGRAANALCLGKAAIELARTAPYIGELLGVLPNEPDSAFIFAHACPPHTDNQAQLEALYPQRPISSPFAALPEHLLYPCRDDCLRALLRTEAPSTPPSRGFAATRQGIADIEAYFSLHQRLTGHRVAGMFRGHDHVTHGYHIHHCHNSFICTLNALGLQATTAAALQTDGDICLLHFCR